MRLNFVLFRVSMYDPNLALMPLVPETLPPLQQKRRSSKLELQVRALHMLLPLAKWHARDYDYRLIPPTHFNVD
jgi:hypothetical protein